MNKTGKETRFLLGGIFIVFAVSFVFSVVLSSLMAENYKKELVNHDYETVGYLLNHPTAIPTEAFTRVKNTNDYTAGYDALKSTGYSMETDMSLLPKVLHFRNQTLLHLFLFLFCIFFSILIIVFLYIRKQRIVLEKAGTSIRSFLEGDTSARIECSEVGDWYRVFHEMNEVTTILSAHAEHEKHTKEFLQATISDMSHQLKTPLAALKMYHEIISDTHTERTVICDFSQKSMREIERIEGVIYTLLKLAKLDAGTIQMNKSTENVSVLMQDVLERFDIWTGHENKTITLSGNKDIVLNCDALWCSETVGNIVKNALEHTQSGDTISIRWEQTPLLTSIIIEDNGNGIHPEDIHNIFKRFYRSRFSQNTRGIGLGLPLAKAIMEAHGGTISVTSKIGKGTAFTLNFL